MLIAAQGKEPNIDSEAVNVFVLELVLLRVKNTSSHAQNTGSLLRRGSNVRYINPLYEVSAGAKSNRSIMRRILLPRFPLPSSVNLHLYYSVDPHERNL